MIMTKILIYEKYIINRIDMMPISIEDIYLRILLMRNPIIK